MRRAALSVLVAYDQVLGSPAHARRVDTLTGLCHAAPTELT